jgi:hypothetical protein
MARGRRRWIQSAIRKPGALRRTLGAKDGIPQAKLQAAAAKGGVTGRRARLALTLKRLGRRRRRG